MNYAVIGANFGDEGKGLVTATLAKQNPKSIVVRFNGGSQAGHTVQQRNGLKFIHSQIPSGCECGNAGHISRFTSFNPVFFIKELEEYEDTFKSKPVITIDPRSIVVTPWDVDYNKLLEKARGSNAQGSVGQGIFAALVRSYNSALRITIGDLISWYVTDNKRELLDRIYMILAYYNYDSEYIKTKAYEDRMMAFINGVTIAIETLTAEFDEIVIGSNNVIFEGAQGLLLDQNSGLFPHVTPSNTGLTNILSLLKQGDLHPIYVTRTYLTRHGAGPMYMFGMPSDGKAYIDALPEDLTNHYNDWQKEFRRDLLSIPQMRFAIDKDLYNASLIVSPDVNISDFELAITWGSYDMPTREGLPSVLDALKSNHNLHNLIFTEKYI